MTRADDEYERFMDQCDEAMERAGLCKCARETKSFQQPRRENKMRTTYSVKERGQQERQRAALQPQLRARAIAALVAARKRFALLDEEEARQEARDEMDLRLARLQRLAMQIDETPEGREFAAETDRREALASAKATVDDYQRKRAEQIAQAREQADARKVRY